MADCHYCQLKELEREATARKQALTIKKSFANGMGGHIVYVHPKRIKLINENNPDHNIYIRAWFRKVPSECSCIIE